ncbi:porin [Arenibaculum pallidiluteum]|uniref:porin n=1 Tax=Arenibaculum pallidiluteum TaxID=2812559 RepID=UPI001A969B56|nr:porin [Arenibaculum pallidiluteum]
MKKILLGTAALLGTAVMAQGAAAQVTVKFGGDIRFDAAWVDDDQPNSKDINFQQEVRFPITAEGKTDNGLTYGAFVRLRNTGSNHGASSTAGTTNGENIYAERKYIYVGGGFGRLEMGDEYGAVTKLTGFAPAVGIGQLDGNYENFTNSGLFQYVPSNYFNRATKITYYSPNLAGFQVGAGYTPEYDQTGDNNSLLRRVPGTSYNDVVELAASYKGEFGGATVNLGGGYTFGDEDTAIQEEMRLWNVSAAVGFGGFTVGGTYFDNKGPLVNDPSPNSYPTLLGAPLTGEQTGWNAGVSYKNGPIGVAAAYGRTESEFTGTGGDLEDTVWSVGAVYTVAPGLNVMVDGYFVDSESANTAGAVIPAGNDATIVMLRTQLLF